MPPAILPTDSNFCAWRKRRSERRFPCGVFSDQQAGEGPPSHPSTRHAVHFTGLAPAVAPVTLPSTSKLILFPSINSRNSRRVSSTSAAPTRSSIDKEDGMGPPRICSIAGFAIVTIPDWEHTAMPIDAFSKTIFSPLSALSTGLGNVVAAFMLSLWRGTNPKRNQKAGCLLPWFSRKGSNRSALPSICPFRHRHYRKIGPKYLVRSSLKWETSCGKLGFN